MSSLPVKKRVETIISNLTEGLHERDEIISVSLLAALAGHNSFLFGPPGTAKSLISRRIRCAFKEASYFECLMNKFSTPEEVVGPVSIKALKNDQYTRKTQGYLPTANFAFLDEIWKSSPAILNTLLTLVNEKTFKNGDVVEQAPLKALIAASNETPPSGQGLEALYDRFSVRLNVPPLELKDNFEALLQHKPTVADINIDEALKVGTEEWQQWQSGIHDVVLSEETLIIINLVRSTLAEQSNESNIYVSDRRWQRAAMLIKASAFFSGRDVTNHTDALLLRHCLWTTKDNRKDVAKIVDNAVRDCGFDTGLDIAELDKEKESLDKEIHDEMYFTEDVYKTVRLNDGKEYFPANIEFKNKYYPSRNKDIKIYILTSKPKSKGDFHPVDEQGNEISNVTCSFDGQGSCTLALDDYNYDYQNTSYTPKISFHKGDKKDNINQRLISALNKSTIELKSKLEENLETVESKLAEYQLSLHTAFVPPAIRDTAIDGIHKQIEEIQIRIEDCNRLSALCEE